VLPLDECEKAIKRHQKVALSWSGGKDSTAVLFYLQPFWPLMTIYWLNTGDGPAETMELAEKVRRLVPNFVEITSDSLSDMNENGYPFEAVPESLTYASYLASGVKPPIVVRPRLECCWKNIMQPCMTRIVEDGNTLVIRGQKEGDPLRNHLLKSGDVKDDIEFLFPIDDESDTSILEWLRQHHPEFVHVAYDLGDRGLTDCIHCTADYGDGDGIRNRYPSIADERLRLRRYVAHELIAVVRLVC